MNSGRLSGALLVIFLILTLGVAGGCGGNDGSNNQDGGNAANEGASQEEGEASKGEGSGETGQGEGSSAEIKIALGDIVSVDTEKRRLVLKPVQGERQIFKIVQKANVTLDDRPAELSNLKKGQQAQIRYIVKKDRERARAVNAFRASGGSE